MKDWSAKLKISKTLLNCRTNGHLIEKVMGRGVDVPSFANRISKWGSSDPQSSQSLDFINNLARKLELEGYDDTVNADAFIEADTLKFIDFFPKHRQNAARAAVGLRPLTPLSSPPMLSEAAMIRTINSKASPASKHRRSSAIFRPLQVHRDVHKQIEPISKGIEKGKVNQHHYYLTPDAAAIWSRVVGAKGYATYENCRASLESMWKNPAWIDRVRQAAPRTIVMLAGGGAYTKDIEMLRGLRSTIDGHDEAINYFIVDISVYMIYDSISKLDEILRLDESLSHNFSLGQVVVTPVNADILQLKKADELFRGEDPVIFTLTAGTVGNISEKRFMDSLSHICRVGDFLVIAADTLSENLDQDSEALLERYKDPEVMQFIRSAVVAAADQLRIPKTVQVIMNDDVDVDILDSTSHRLSDVPGSFSVTYLMKTEDEDLILISSTRYETDKFTSFFESFDWEFFGSVPSKNPRFSQFMFQKKASKVLDKSRPSRPVTGK